MKKFLSVLFALIFIVPCFVMFTACDKTKDDTKFLATELDESMVVMETVFGYTGEEIKPEVKLMVGEDVIDSKEYSVVYSNNINASNEASVTIKANDESVFLSGTVTKNFTITKAVKTATTLKDVRSALADSNYELVNADIQELNIPEYANLVVGEGKTLKLSKDTKITTSSSSIIVLNGGSIVGTKDEAGENTNSISGNILVVDSNKNILKNVNIEGNIAFNNLIQTYSDVVTLSKLGLTLSDTKIVGVKQALKEYRFDVDNKTKDVANANASAIMIDRYVDACLYIEGEVEVAGYDKASGIGVHYDSKVEIAGSGVLYVCGCQNAEDIDANGQQIYGYGGAGIGGIVGFGTNVSDVPTGSIYIHGINKKQTLSVYARGVGNTANAIGGTLGPNNELRIEDAIIEAAIGGCFGARANNSDRSYLNSTPVGGAGIGAGYYPDFIYGDGKGSAHSVVQKVIIENSIVNAAYGGGKAAGIGAVCHSGVGLTIKNSTIKDVIGGESGAGIGGGRHGEYSLEREQTAENFDAAKTYFMPSIYIDIEDSIIAHIQGGEYGSGIGNGYDNYTHRRYPVYSGNLLYGPSQKTTINIKGNSIIYDVNGGINGAGIGLGYQSCNLYGEIEESVILYDIHGGLAERGNSTMHTKFADHDECHAIGSGNVSMERSGIVVDESYYPGEIVTVGGEGITTVKMKAVWFAWKKGKAYRDERNVAANTIWARVKGLIYKNYDATTKAVVKNQFGLDIPNETFDITYTDYIDANDKSLGVQQITETITLVIKNADGSINEEATRAAEEAALAKALEIEALECSQNPSYIVENFDIMGFDINGNYTEVEANIVTRIETVKGFVIKTLQVENDELFKALTGIDFRA